MATDCSILSIVPYRVIPATTGGHAGIVHLHDALGRHCQDIIAGTTDNGNADQYSFTLQHVFPNTSKRYIPYSQFQKLKGLAKAYDISNIYLDHPYMAPTAIALAQKLEIPWYMRSHNIESDRFRTLGKKWWRIMHWYERYAMRKATGVFFVTPEDAQWAQEHYGLPAERCHIIPFGTGLKQVPDKDPAIKKKLAAEFGIDGDKPWLYFLGVLDYYPNIQAVEFILNEIIPRLDKTNQRFEILLAGKELPDELQERIKALPHMHYMGFVPDLEHFLKACDVMLNPVLLGGGIKTKAVEALAYNKRVVSTHSGAAGLLPDVCGAGLYVSPDHNWDGFVSDIIKAIEYSPDTPAGFYQTYNWDHIARKVISIMDLNAQQKPPR